MRCQKAGHATQLGFIQEPCGNIRTAAHSAPSKSSIGVARNINEPRQLTGIRHDLTKLLCGRFRPLERNDDILGCHGHIDPDSYRVVHGLRDSRPRRSRRGFSGASGSKRPGPGEERPVVGRLLEHPIIFYATFHRRDDEDGTLVEGIGLPASERFLPFIAFLGSSSAIAATSASLSSRYG